MKSKRLSWLSLLTALILLLSLLPAGFAHAAAKPGRLAGVTIGLDPGHQKKGNHDTEPNAPKSKTKKAKVSSGTQGKKTKKPEHEINLAVGLALQKALKAEGATVVLTRTKADVNISNVERAKMMNEKKVDLVLRLHCDGNDDSSVRGASMLVPSGPHCKAIEKDSLRYGTTIYNAYIKATGMKDRGVKKRDDQTGFNWSTVPICNIEMGFLSNAEDEKKLVDAKFQEKIVSGLVEGIVNCFPKKK